MNKVILIGNVGQDPELRHSSSGTAVLNIRMATSERYKDKQSGETKETTEWHSVVIWDRRAEALSKFIRKGSKIMVDGTLQTRSWEKDGEKRYSTEVKAFNIELLDKKPADGEQRQQGGGGSGWGD